MWWHIPNVTNVPTYSDIKGIKYVNVITGVWEYGYGTTVRTRRFKLGFKPQVRKKQLFGNHRPKGGSE